jgi:hypothetical protein
MARSFVIHCAALAILAPAVWLGGHAFAVELIGYVPNYRMGSADYASETLPEQLKLLDEVRYFGITVDRSAKLTTCWVTVNGPS